MDFYMSVFFVVVVVVNVFLTLPNLPNFVNWRPPYNNHNNVY